MKLKNKYRVNCNFDLFFQIAFYKKIEKRGYKIIELSENRDEAFLHNWAILFQCLNSEYEFKH